MGREYKGLDHAHAARSRYRSQRVKIIQDAVAVHVVPEVTTRRASLLAIAATPLCRFHSLEVPREL